MDMQLLRADMPGHQKEVDDDAPSYVVVCMKVYFFNKSRCFSYYKTFQTVMAASRWKRKAGFARNRTVEKLTNS